MPKSSNQHYIDLIINDPEGWENTIKKLNPPTVDLTDVDLSDLDLSGRDLSSCTGLLRHQLRGAVLRRTQLPPNICFDFEPFFTMAANTRNAFILITLACAYCILTIFVTSDIDLIFGTQKLKLPLIDMDAPMTHFFIGTPIILLFFHYLTLLILDTTWQLLKDMPVVFPDGTTLAEKVQPWMFSSLLYRWQPKSIHLPPPPARCYSKSIVISLIAWWITPITLFGLWIRYLPVHTVGISIFGLATTTLAATLAITFRDSAKSLIDKHYNNHHWHILLYLCVSFCIPTPYLILTPNRPRIELLDATLKFPSFPVEKNKTQPLPQTPARNLESRNFNQSKTENANLMHSNLSNTTFTNASLIDTNLHDAVLNNTSFSNSYLERVTLTNSKGINCNFSTSRANTISFNNASITKSQFIKSIIINASFIDSNLADTSFESATLQAADFSHSNLEGLQMLDTTLVKAIFLDARLGNAWLQDANLNGAVLNFAKCNAILGHRISLNGAQLIKTDLRQAFLQNGDLSKANLTGADLSESKCQNALAKSADFTGANLAQGEFQAMSLNNAKFINADLSHANFNCANFKWAIFSGSELSGTDLSGTNIQIDQLLDSCIYDTTIFPIDEWLSNKTEVEKGLITDKLEANALQDLNIKH